MEFGGFSYMITWPVKQLVKPPHEQCHTQYQPCAKCSVTICLIGANEALKDLRKFKVQRKKDIITIFLFFISKNFYLHLKLVNSE